MADVAPTFGWICTDSWFLPVAEAMLDEEYGDPLLKPGDANEHRIGRIGSLNVVINCLPQPPRAADAARMALNMATGFTGIKAILMTGFGSGIPSAGVRLGDLVISQAITRYDSDAESSSTPTTNIVQRAVDVLQGEIGTKGYWLSSNLSLNASNFRDVPQFAQRPNSDLPDCLQLHFGNIGSSTQDMQNEESPGRLAAVKNIICIDTAAAGLTNLPIPAVVILGVTNYVDSHEGDTWKRYVSVNAASCAKEFILVMTDNLANGVPDLEGTEMIVPPHMNPRLPPFQHHQYPHHGNAVLLVIPTANESKGRLLQEAFSMRKPDGMIIHTVAVPSDSDVGEQPYNEAGIIGAHNRISNALRRLDTAVYQETFRVKRIGTVIVASVENYIQTDNVDRPTDYGVVVIHNATTQQTTACLSWGVTVPTAYVNRARRFGFNKENLNQGKVTVGQILAAHVPGLDKADWQAVLAGHSRYDLLKDAIRQLPIPW